MNQHNILRVALYALVCAIAGAIVLGAVGMQLGRLMLDFTPDPGLGGFLPIYGGQALGVLAGLVCGAILGVRWATEGEVPGGRVALFLIWPAVFGGLGLLRQQYLSLDLTTVTIAGFTLLLVPTIIGVVLLWPRER